MSQDFKWEKFEEIKWGKIEEIEILSNESFESLYFDDFHIHCINIRKKNNELIISLIKDNDPYLISFDNPDYYISVPCDVKTGKKIVENTFSKLLKDFPDSNNYIGISFDTVCSYFDMSVQNFKMQSPAPGAVENIINKENSMSQEQEERTFRPSIDAAEKVAKEQAFKNALSQRKAVLNAIKDGTLACLPGANGFADTEPAVNLVSNDFYHGANMLYLKDHQKQNNFPTAEYVTEYQVEKAGLSINKEEKGRFIHWEQKDDQTGEWEKKSVLLFNVAQVSDPQAMKAFVEQQKQERFEKYVEKQRLDRGDPNYTPEQKQKTPGPIVECTSTDPEKYLGQYLAAVSMGGKFKVSPEQSAEFSKNMENSLLEQMGNGYPDPFKLSRISNAANQYCKDVKMEIKMETQKADYKLDQQQTQSRGPKL